MSLSSLIVQREIATIRQVEEALARQVLYGGDLVTNLLEVAKLDEPTLTMLLAESFGMAAATLGPLPMPSDRARSLVTGEMASNRAMVPLGIEGSAIVLAVAEPLPKEAEEELTFALGLRVIQRIAPMVRVREALARVYGAPLERRLQRLLGRLGAAPPAPAEAIPPPADSAPVASGRPPFRASPTPSSGSPKSPSVRPRAHTEMGLHSPSVVPNGSDTIPVTSPGPSAGETGTPRATLLQRGSSAPRGQRRRRGPIVPEQARKELEEAPDRDAILDLYFDYARQYFDYSALFVVHGDIAEGREAFGDGASRERVQAIGVPLDLPSVLSAARDAHGAVRVTPGDDGLDPVLLADLERTTRGEVLVVPIVVRKRSVALFYGDSGDDGVDPNAVKEVATFGLLVGQSFEKLIVRKKLQGAISGQPATSPSVRAEASSVAPKPASVVPKPGVSLPPAEFMEAQNSGASEPPSDPSLDEPTPAFVAHAASLRLPTEALSPSIALQPSDPPPANALLVRRPSGPPIPREEPETHDTPAPPTPTVPDSLAPASPHGAPPSESFAVAPHRPPSSRAGGDLAASLPSVIVDVDEEFGALVDRVVTMGAEEAAEAELLRQGQNAMPAIMSRFPGPTVVDRARVEDGSLRAAECGPVLRLIAGQRRAALPFVLPLVGDGNPERRYWATFLLTELPYPEAVEPLVPRLFDPDASVRRVARLAARAVGDVAPESLMEKLVRYYRDPSLSNDRRIEMIDTLGELRERLAVPLLIDALGDESEDVAAAARRALMTVSRQDLGRDAKKWQSWWSQNGGRHRIEWLIDALMHEVPAIRRAAGDELKALTKEYFGYYDDLPRKEREKSQQRYREWWASEGRLRYQRR